MVLPHRQALRAWLLPFRYMDGTGLSSYSPPCKVAIKRARDGRSKSGLHATSSGLGVAVSGAPPVGQSQRPVSGTDSIRGRDSRVTEPEPRSVVDDTPGVQLAAILALDPYGPVVDGHTVGG